MERRAYFSGRALVQPCSAGPKPYLCTCIVRMDKREIILEATLQLVLQEGFYHLNMKKVARAAHVAAGTIYLYFASKEELIIELYRYVTRLYLAAVLEVQEGEQDLTLKIQRMMRRFLEFFLYRPDCFSYLQQFRTSPFAFKDKEAHAMLLEPLFTLVEKARAARIVKSLPNELLLALVVGPVHEAVMMWQAGTVNLVDKELQEQLLLACWENVASPPVVGREAV